MEWRRISGMLALASAMIGCGGGEPPHQETTTTTTTTTSTTTSSTTTTVELPPLPAVEGPAPIADTNPDPNILEFDLVARENTVQLLPGGATTMLNYNDQLPGPLLHAR